MYYYYYYYITMLNTQADVPIIIYIKYYKTSRENDEMLL